MAPAGYRAAGTSDYIAVYHRSSAQTLREAAQAIFASHSPWLVVYDPAGRPTSRRSAAFVTLSAAKSLVSWSHLRIIPHETEILRCAQNDRAVARPRCCSGAAKSSQKRASRCQVKRNRSDTKAKSIFSAFVAYSCIEIEQSLVRFWHILCYELKGINPPSPQTGHSVTSTRRIHQHDLSPHQFRDCRRATDPAAL
jgi:hypothetical protein